MDIPLMKNERAHCPNCVKVSVSLPLEVADAGRKNAKGSKMTFSFYVTSAMRLYNAVSKKPTKDERTGDELEVLRRDIDMEIAKLQLARSEIEQELAAKTMAVL